MRMFVAIYVLYVSIYIGACTCVHIHPANSEVLTNTLANIVAMYTDVHAYIIT